MKKIFTLFISFISLTGLYAQDEAQKKVVYMVNNKPVTGKIESLPEAKKISILTSTGELKTFQREKALVAFNEYGRYLVVASLPNTPVNAKKIIDDFNNKPVPLPLNDVIFKAVPFEIIPCTIQYSDAAINYRTLEGKTGSINKDDVLAIIRKDGTHEITRDVSEVAPILEANITKFKALIEKPEPKEEPNHNHQRPPAPPAKDDDLSDKPLLTKEEKEKYSNQAIDYIKSFKDYLNIIGDKSKSPTEKKEAINSALSLFTPGATIEITSKKRPGAKARTVESYLWALSSLSYSSIEIEYANLKFVSEFSRGEDGNYYGLVRGEQSFKGFGADGKTPIYSDVIDRNYKVQLESINVIRDGGGQAKWKILLSDVTVSK